MHKFQGLEFEIVIFDTVESPCVKPSDFTTGSQGSKSMRLVNVAITRAKQKLIVVANYNYILQEMPTSATMRLVVEAAANSPRLSSLDIVNFASTSSEDSAAFPNTRQKAFHSLATAIDTQKRSSDDAEIRHFTAQNFDEAFLQDIRNARLSIIIASPFISLKRANELLDDLCKKKKWVSK